MPRIQLYKEDPCGEGGLRGDIDIGQITKYHVDPNNPANMLGVEVDGLPQNVLDLAGNSFTFKIDPYPQDAGTLTQYQVEICNFIMRQEFRLNGHFGGRARFEPIKR
jgi:hypothetical protein